MRAHRHRRDINPNIFTLMWESFWHPPTALCPKCGGKKIQYYDPFFFSPMRTLRGRRRLQCVECRFVWRPSSKGKSILQMLRPF